MFIRVLSFSGCLASIGKIPEDIKCLSLNNQQCMTYPALINLRHNWFTQGLRFFPLAVNLDWCLESYNTLNDLPNKVCVPNKTENLKFSTFNVMQ